MATTYVDGVATNTTGTAASLTKPTLTANGHVLLCFANVDGTGDTAGVPTGGTTWTLIGSKQNISNGDTQTFALYAKVAGAAEPSTYTWTTSHALDVTAIILAYSGVDTSGGIAGAIVAQLATNPNSGSPPASPVSIAANSITTTVNGQTVVWFGCVDWNAGTAAAFTDPGSTTRRVVATPAKFTNALAVDFVKTTAGATGTITGTGTLATKAGNFGAFMVALKDTAGASGTLATTNANDTSAAAGTTTVLGTLAKTNANDASAAAGTPTVLGTIARTNASDTSAASGTTAVAGTLARTNANDSNAASGSPVVSGSLATTNASDTLAASGGGAVSGSLAYTNANDMLAASGVVVSPSAEIFSGGYFPDLGTVGERRKKKEPEGIEIAELPQEVVAVLPKAIKRRKTVTLDQLVGAAKQADMSLIDIEVIFQEAKRKKRQQDDEEILLFY